MAAYSFFLYAIGFAPVPLHTIVFFTNLHYIWKYLHEIARI